MNPATAPAGSAPSAIPTSPRQRLIVCLDGTWNNRNDGTNVVHHYDLIRRGLVPTATGGTMLQHKYYDSGVGTGVLDRVSGGGFGFGLDENVRQAYDWLVEHYHDAGVGNGHVGDEIFIFGFSRGAYTARSLVGMIGAVGLLRRGAPMTINQLWQHYCVLGRQREQRRSLLERWMERPARPARELRDLKLDPWEHPNTPPPAAPNLTETERLLQLWSRRARITFLGVYDTVGSMGVDALAIPVLKSRLALHHNMRPTTLIENARHALAIDEHRSNFSHTAFVAFSGHGRSRGQSNRVPIREYWQRKDREWARRIQQRWFVGAHANVGGGYENNLLGEEPFRWMLGEAAGCGLVSEPWQPTPASRPLPAPTDSYAQFSRPLWAMILRAKRHYRQIAPPDAARGCAPTQLVRNRPRRGFSLCHVNEELHPSVWDYFAPAAARTAQGASTVEVPPNLFECRDRIAVPPGIRLEPQRHRWCESGFWSYALVSLLGTFAAVGAVAALQIFVPHLTARPLLAGWLALAGFLYVGTDAAESWMRYKLARDGGRPITRAICDAIYWTRALGVLLSLLGVAVGLGAAVRAGMSAGNADELLVLATDFVAGFAWAAAGASATTLLAWLRFGQRERRRELFGAAAGGAMALGAGAVATALGYYLLRLFAPLVVPPARDTLASLPEFAPFAGLLLLLQISFVYFLRTLHWSGEPMARLNLGLIVPLQLTFWPAHTRAVLDRWHNRLKCWWRDATQQNPTARSDGQMRDAVAETLARDAFGLIPVYFAVILFGLWFAADPRWGLGWTWLERPVLGWPLWLVIPLLALVTDVIETAVQAWFLRLHRLQQFGAWWARLVVPFSGLASVIKFACLLTATACVFWAVGEGTLRLMEPGVDAGWRSVPVLLTSAAGAIAMATFLGSLVYYRLLREPQP